VKIYKAQSFSTKTKSFNCLFSTSVLLMLLTLLTAMLASAQDTRTVTEPSFPAVCSTLTANLAAGLAGVDETVAGNYDTTRVQTAINGCAAGQGVELQAAGGNGAFLIGPITLKAGVTLLVDAGVTVYGSRNPRDYDKTAGKCGTIDSLGTGCKALITVSGADGAGIMGYGKIDGRGGEAMLGTSETWWQLATAANGVGSQNNPRMVQVNSNNFTLYKITIQNSPNFHVYFAGDGFTAWGVKVVAPYSARNTDAIDPAGATNVTITKSYISTGDDDVAIKGGGSASSNMTISHNHFYAGHGMSIGSETNSGVSNISVTDLVFAGNAADSNGNGLRIKSDSSRGGLVNNVVYDGVCIKDVKHPAVFDPYYTSSTGSLYPKFQNITMRNIRVSNFLSGGSIKLTGYSATYPLGLTLDNVIFDQTPTSIISSSANVLVGPGPSNISGMISGTGVTVTNNVTNPGASPYDCTGKYMYISGELFGNANITSADAVALSAIVQPAVSGAVAPTGTVNLLEGATVVSTVPLSDLTQFSIANPGAGTHTYTAHYSGDSTYSALDFGPFTVTVTDGSTVSTSTSLTPSSNTLMFGTPVTLTATVSATSGTATGTVRFVNGASSELGTIALDGTGTATLTGVTLPPGINSVSAIYDGATGFASSESAGVPITVTDVTTTAVTPSATSVSSGVPVTFTANVTSSTGLIATGTVTFMDGASAIDSELLDDTGSASFTTSTLTLGSHNISAAYTGATGFGASTSQAVAVAITGGQVAQRALLLPYTINKVAGTWATAGATGNGGPATAATLNGPQAVAADGNGNVYIAEQVGNTLRKVDANGNITLFAGGASTVCAAATNSSGDNCPPLQTKFSSLRGVTVDAAGNVYPIDYSTSLIHKIDPAGTLMTVVAGGGGSLGDGGPATSAKLANPFMAAFDSAGNMYIADRGNASVRKVDATTKTITTLWTLAGSTPTGVAVDSADNIYISDTAHFYVLKVDRVTGASTVVGGTGATGYTSLNGTATAMAIAKPTGVATDWAGNIYTMDLTNKVVWFIDKASGIMRNVSGNRGSALTAPCTAVIDAGGDGCRATQSIINGSGSSYNMLSVDAAGNLYFPEYNNMVVRKVSINTGFPDTVVGNSVTQTLSLHLNAGETPATNFTTASGTGFSVLPTAAVDGIYTSDYLVQVTFTPAAPGDTSADVFVTTSTGRLLKFTVNGKGVDPAPTAQSQTVNMNTNDVDQPITLTGTDQFGASLIFTVVTQPTHGTLSGTAPDLTYTPARGYYGTDGFTFKVNNGSDSNVASVTLNVNNTPPVAQDASATASSGGGSLPLTLSATEASTAPMVYTITSLPSHGTLNPSGIPPYQLPNANVSYTADLDYSGADSFTFKANNGAGDSNVATVSFTVQAPIDPASILVTPASITFAPTTIGYGSSSQPITLTNNSSAPITVANPTAPAGFSIYYNLCTGYIGVGKKCSIWIASTPTAVNQTSGNLSLYYGGTDPKVIALNASPIAQVVPNFTSLSFADTPAGQGSSSLLVHFVNRMGVPITMTAATSTADFLISYNGCNATLQPNAGCDVYVRFTPTVGGALSGTLTVTPSTGNAVPVSLSGNGLAYISTTPSTLTFNTTNVGTGSSSQMITMQNVTGVPITMTMGITGDFAISGNNCTGTVLPNAGCNVWVRFNPTIGGSRTGTLTVTPSSGAPVGIGLSGTGAAFVTVSTTTLVYDTVNVGQGSSSQMITIVNHTGVPVAITPVVTGDFLLSGNGCTTSIQQGSGCNVWVRFTPKSAGPLNGTLTVTPSSGTAKTVTLLGSKFTVAQDGSGDFSTVQAAINALPAGGGVIGIKPGTYTEVVNVVNPNVQLRGLGSDPSQVVITYDNYNGNSGGSTSASATVTVSGDGFYAENLTMQNTYNMEVDQAIANSQAVALYEKGDRAVFRNMRFIGRQDTLYTSSKGCSGNTSCTPGRQYFYNSYIEGNVDYIFGDGASVFENCTIHTVRHESITNYSESGETVTAQSKRYPDQLSGFVFTNSTFDSGPIPAGELGHSSLDVGYDVATGLPYTDPTKFKSYLGRPWVQGSGPYSTVVLLNAKLNILLNPDGWESWTPPSTADLAIATYAEYNSTGIGATGPREAFTKILNASQIAPYATKTFLAGSDNWDPTVIK
jgi:polygalacturonase